MKEIFQMLGGDIELDDNDLFQEILVSYNSDVEFRFSALTESLYTYLKDFDANTVKEKLRKIDLSIRYISIVSMNNLSSEDQIIIQKFFDHTLLELTRKQEYILQNEIFEEKVYKFNKSLEEKQQQLNDLLTADVERQKEMLKNDLKIKSQQLEQSLSTNIITVLGIFAAFITAFMGGIGAFNSIMQSINQTNVFRFVFTLFLFGMIYFDTCYALIYSVSKMLNKSICATIGVETRNMFKRYPIFCIFNMLMLLGMFGIVILFYVDKFFLK